MPSACTSPSRPAAPASRVRNISSIRRGDYVEARSGDQVFYRGEVRDTAPGLATLWLNDEDSGMHTAVSSEDFTIWKTRH